MNRVCAALVLALSFLLSSSAFASTPERTSTIADRELINVTVYNGGTALVHDRRRVRLTNGMNRIAWRDVSANIDATSALLDSLDPTTHVSVLEQNFDYDLLDPSALLKTYVGKTVTVVHDARFAGERDTREEARILSINGGIVLQYHDRIETDVRGHIIYPISPKDFRDKPTLVLDVSSDRSGTKPLDLTYLTNGLSWRADYVGVLAPDERHFAFTGLVTLSNDSGIDYDNAHLQLVAGNVSIQRGVPLGSMARTTVADTYSVGAVTQQNYFEYHLYTVARPTSILDKQTKQLTLFSAHDVPVRKTLELRGSPGYYQAREPDIGDRLPIGVYVSFENRGGELGIPLPGGVVRLYENDSRGVSQFVGSDSISHTPANESVRLHLGDSFDVTARKRQTDFTLEQCASDSSYEITIGNAKPIAQDVLVVEPLPGDWTITQESLAHVKSSSSTATWTVHVPSMEHATLTYSAHVKWCGWGQSRT